MFWHFFDICHNICKSENKILFFKNKILDICSDISLTYVTTNVNQKIRSFFKNKILDMYSDTSLSYAKTKCLRPFSVK